MTPLLLLAIAAFSQGVPAPPPDPIPVLVVTGANNHDWEWTSESLEQILTESGRFDVIVTTDPAATLANPQVLRSFRAVVLDYNGPRWGAAAETGFLEAVRDGLGVVVVHAANNAFSGWIEYEKLVALCWRRGTGHGAFHRFGVEVTDRDHPVTRTLPDMVAHPDELYHRLVHMHGTDYRVLATAHSSAESGGTGADEPMVLVKNYGEGRVFHTPLGHVWKGNEGTRASQVDPQFRTLIVRGTEWAATGDVRDGREPANQLASWDAKAGWKLLFDGESTAGWTRHGGGGFPDRGWVVENGALRHLSGGGGGDITTIERYSDFELEFEWKVAGGANSGVKYRVAPVEEPKAMLGPEYQVLDDAPKGNTGKHSAASLYDVYKPGDKSLAPVGMWNRARIVADGSRIEHWLNGRRVLRAQVGSNNWNEHVAASKFSNVAGFATSRPGHIGLQDHGGEAWYRSVKLRDLSQPIGREVPLFDGKSLAGWHELGDAVFRVEDGVIHGEVGGGGQSFLVSDATYADFILELELRIQAGNSGVQVRSQVNEKGRLYGYQLEVDPSPRSWSGGLYDEARRGWLQNLADNPEGREAFLAGGWNRYRIECVEQSIRCWVNGVPTADFLDSTDAEGHIALQVHSGRDTKLSWRNIVLRVL
ncbi:MAG: family 16 glycoside hydrolase [Planctomycetota bacterium]